MRRIFTRKVALISLGGLLGLGLLFLGVWSIIAGPVTVYRIITSGDTTIYDYRRFPGRDLQASPAPFELEKDPQESVGSATVSLEQQGEVKLDELLQSTDTIAFLVVKDDVVTFERYFKGHTESDISQVFSSSKSLLSILIGTAIADGYIESVKQPVSDYIPELAAAGFGQVTIEDLLNMQSNLNYFENDDMFGEHVIFNFTNHLEDEILKLTLLQTPDQQFRYKSGDNALLGLILDRALGEKSITQYMQERLWNPLGMQDRGVWGVDREGGLERTWCCISASARDFAKFGRLFLRNGDWDGAQVVPADWVQKTIGERAYSPDAWPENLSAIGASNYHYQWWLLSPEEGDYATWGKDGQYLYVDPGRNLVMVRLGETDGGVPWFLVFQQLAEQIK
jgi:CubicO group peptidase (beta-lactamase class C family)